MATGHKVDTMLDGCVTCSSSQQQRTYRVHADPEFIWWVLRCVFAVYLEEQAAGAGVWWWCGWRGELSGAGLEPICWGE